MSGYGRGRGESANMGKAAEDEPGAQRFAGVMIPGRSVPVIEVPTDTSSSSGSSTSGEKTVRGRGGFRRELHTIPSGVKDVKAPANAAGVPCQLLCNFVNIQPMNEREIYQYRVDFEPNIESLSLRRRLFQDATKNIFARGCVFDGMSDVRSSTKAPQDETNFSIPHPSEPGTTFAITMKMVGKVLWGSFEMLRVYNMNMKQALRTMGFFQVSQSGAYVHPQLTTPIGNNDNLVTIRGFRTAVNIHDGDRILMNLESCHKLMQRKNVLQIMTELRQLGGNIQETIKSSLNGKLVVTNYNKIVYRIEDVNFDLKPISTFHDRRQNRPMSYVEYYQSRYNVSIGQQSQPMLLVTQNNRRAGLAREEEQQHDIYVVPELCNIAGLTEQQRSDNRLKIDLIKSSQIPPADRVAHIRKFLEIMHRERQVKEMLEKWGYSYGQEPLALNARILNTEAIGVGRCAMQDHKSWPKVDNMGSFEREIMKEHLAVAPNFHSMVLMISRRDQQNEASIVNKLKGGFMKVGLRPDNVDTKRLDSDSTTCYTQAIRSLPKSTTACVIIMPNQNKEKYDSIKKLASVELGIITQVVTSRLMMDERKANGAAVKIGIQIAAKIGGEPWFIHLPLANAMICGYDTYHDSAQRGRSYGAFTASMNQKFSRWFSKADVHDNMSELSSHMAENLGLALRKYKETNAKFPERIFIYRDGVGDGQLEHVFEVELKQVRGAIEQLDKKIKMAFVVVNKRIGARFFMKNNQTFINPPPGTVIDHTVTRKTRYDFYLISQSTRNGTISPTYYNIIYDQSNLDAAKHQAMAYKFCLLYYNWTGTVRVPAPCQYAHKLALLCGEHLHGIPNSILDDRLHFL